MTKGGGVSPAPRAERELACADKVLLLREMRYDLRASYVGGNARGYLHTGKKTGPERSGGTLAELT